MATVTTSRNISWPCEHHLLRSTIPVSTFAFMTGLNWCIISKLTSSIWAGSVPRALTWSNLIWRLALASVQVCRFCVLLTIGCVSSSINNNKYLQYHTRAGPLLRLGRSGSDPEPGRKCSSTSYTDFRFITWQDTILRQFPITIFLMTQH